MRIVHRKVYNWDIKLININYSNINYINNLAMETQGSNNILNFFPEEIDQKCVKMYYNYNVYIQLIVNKFECD